MEPCPSDDVCSRGTLLSLLPRHVEVAMSRRLLVLSAAAFICGSSQIAFADEAGTFTGAVGGAAAGAMVGGPVGAIVGGVGGAAIGNSMTNHRHYYHHRYAYRPYRHHYHYYAY
jgi:uncharacterized membrane protein